MHTFFINTSKKSLNGYEVLFDIHYENKSLVSMDCPLSDWYDKDKGYLTCVKQMSDLIDGYVELNNAYNLIIYIDLSENKAYSAIQRDAFHDKEREECCRAMHILFTHAVSESIVAELINAGRRPHNVLLMFGEEKKFTEFKVASSDPSKPAIMKHLFGFIGLPNAAVVEHIAKSVDSSDVADKIGALSAKILEVCGEEIVPGIRAEYQGDLQLWYDEIVNDADIEKANLALFERISHTNRVEAGRTGIETVSCPYDGYACRVNKCALALSELNLAIHLLKCVEASSIYEKNPDEEERRLIPFRSYTVEEISPLLKNKEKLYAEKAEEIETLAKSYAELKLAPQLLVFDHAKFGLDMYGDKATDLVINDAVAEEKDNKEDGEDKTETNDPETVVITGNDKEVTVVEKTGRALFSREEFPTFDYNYDHNSDQMLKKNATPQQYIEQAKKVRKHHLEYLKKLKIHVSEVLSNYAGKSKENKPALLQIGGYRYAGIGDENKSLVSVEDVSQKAYDSMIDQYMEFCAVRSVAITDIEEQCNWFVSRVHQIKESLKKIKLVGIGLLIAIIALYIPFAVIQFEAIVENALTFAIALGSVTIPIALLCTVFAFVAVAQKKKYLKAWLEFKEKSDQALEENTLAAQKYDQLLSVIIPALRWVYEYKLDVDYCAECCSVADAKIEHHQRKLRDRVFAIQNILSDLEYNVSDADDLSDQDTDTAGAIDYNVSFCSGKQNRAFYSVIDDRFFESSNR